MAICHSWRVSVGFPVSRPKVARAAVKTAAKAVSRNEGGAVEPCKITRRRFRYDQEVKDFLLILVILGSSCVLLWIRADARSITTL